MVFFFAAFSIHWASRGNASSVTIVGTVILVTLLMVVCCIVLTRNGGNRYAGIHLKLPFHLSAAKGRVLGFIRMGRRRRDHTREPQSNTEGVGLVPIGVDLPLPLHDGSTMQQSGSHSNPESSST
jgi:hypothetical protein